MSYVYLASPYSPKNGECIEERYQAALKAAAALMEKGLVVFSPIAHSHSVQAYLPEKLRFDHEFWLKQDFAILRHAQAMVVLMLPGWEQSEGIKRELAVARACDIPVDYLLPQ